MHTHAMYEMWLLSKTLYCFKFGHGLQQYDIQSLEVLPVYEYIFYFLYTHKNQLLCLSENQIKLLQFYVLSVKALELDYLSHNISIVYSTAYIFFSNTRTRHTKLFIHCMFKHTANISSAPSVYYYYFIPHINNIKFK